MQEREERSVAQQVKMWREWKGMSQQELSDLANVSKTTIVQLENERTKPNFKTIARLAMGLNITREQLLHSTPRAE